MQEKKKGSLFKVVYVLCICVVENQRLDVGQMYDISLIGH